MCNPHLLAAGKIYPGGRGCCAGAEGSLRRAFVRVTARRQFSCFNRLTALLGAAPAPRMHRAGNGREARRKLTRGQSRRRVRRIGPRV
jgi:hypothetical protein